MNANSSAKKSNAARDALKAKTKKIMEFVEERIRGDEHIGKLILLELAPKGAVGFKIQIETEHTDESVTETFKSDIWEEDGVVVRCSDNIQVGDKVELVLLEGGKKGAEWRRWTDTTHTVTEEELKATKKTRPKFDGEALCGPKGLLKVLEHFPNLKFRGAGFETQDLHTLVQAYREWAYNMFPRLNSEQIFRRVESLGSSKRVQAHVAELYDADAEEQWRHLRAEKMRMEGRNPDSPNKDKKESEGKGSSNSSSGDNKAAGNAGGGGESKMEDDLNPLNAANPANPRPMSSKPGGGGAGLESGLGLTSEEMRRHKDSHDRMQDDQPIPPEFESMDTDAKGPGESKWIIAGAASYLNRPGSKGSNSNPPAPAKPELTEEQKRVIDEKKRQAMERLAQRKSKAPATPAAAAPVDSKRSTGKGNASAAVAMSLSSNTDAVAPSNTAAAGVDTQAAMEVDSSAAAVSRTEIQPNSNAPAAVVPASPDRAALRQFGSPVKAGTVRSSPSKSAAAIAANSNENSTRDNERKSPEASNNKAVQSPSKQQQQPPIARRTLDQEIDAAVANKPTAAALGMEDASQAPFARSRSLGDSFALDPFASEPQLELEREDSGFKEDDLFQ